MVYSSCGIQCSGMQCLWHTVPVAHSAYGIQCSGMQCLWHTVPNTCGMQCSGIQWLWYAMQWHSVPVAYRWVKAEAWILGPSRRALSVSLCLLGGAFMPDCTGLGLCRVPAVLWPLSEELMKILQL